MIVYRRIRRRAAGDRRGGQVATIGVVKVRIAQRVVVGRLVPLIDAGEDVVGPQAAKRIRRVVV